MNVEYIMQVKPKTNEYKIHNKHLNTEDIPLFQRAGLLKLAGHQSLQMLYEQHETTIRVGVTMIINAYRSMCFQVKTAYCVVLSGN